MEKGTHGRKDRLIKERRHDVYYDRSKCPAQTQCQNCGALFVNGRWTWEEPSSSAEVNKTVCPACQRIADRFPAGYVQLKGAFFEEHRPEILNLILNVEKQEKSARPLERIMAITTEKTFTCVTTTGLHLARRIGEALSRAYKGDYAFRYADAEQSIRVYWER